MTGSVFVFLLPLLLPPSGALRGALLSESAEPLANARIWILELTLSERTRSDGSFVFENVPPGTYQILAETDIRAVATREATVEAGRTTELALSAELDLLRVNEVVTVTGRADELIGVSDSASECVVGQKDLEARAVLRPGYLLETVPGISVATLRWLRPVGMASSTSIFKTRCCCVLWTSTTGVSPLTVIVSSIPPTRSSALIVAVNDPVNSMPSRLTVLKLVRANVTV